MIELIDKLIDSSRRTLCNNNQGLNDYLDWTSILRRRLNQIKWCKYNRFVEDYYLWRQNLLDGPIPLYFSNGIGSGEWLAKEKVSRIEKCRMS